MGSSNFKRQRNQTLPKNSIWRRVSSIHKQLRLSINSGNTPQQMLNASEPKYPHLTLCIEFVSFCICPKFLARLIEIIKESEKDTFRRGGFSNAQRSQPSSDSDRSILCRPWPTG